MKTYKKISGTIRYLLQLFIKNMMNFFIVISLKKLQLCVNVHKLARHLQRI